MFFTWVACSRNHRPSTIFESNQSMVRAFICPYLFQISDRHCFGRGTRRLISVAPNSVDVVVLRECLEKLRNIAGHELTAPPGRSLVSNT